jgi:hypothetical protein
LAKHGYSDTYGARAIARMVRTDLLLPLAQNHNMRIMISPNLSVRETMVPKATGLRTIQRLLKPSLQRHVKFLLYKKPS